jgi:hypothetical protein
MTMHGGDVGVRELGRCPRLAQQALARMREVQ